MSFRFVSTVLMLTLLTACGGGGGGGSSPPPTSSAANDVLTLEEDTSAQVDVTANDTNITPSSARITSQPANGSASISGGTITYTPNADFNGVDSIAYAVDSNNNSGSHSATLSITVNSVNDAPVATSDASSTSINTPIEIDVLVNDSDVDDEIALLTVQIIDATTNGALTLLENQLVSYQPSLDFTGQDSFTYQALDAAGAQSNIVTVSITVVDLSQTVLLIEDIAIPTSGYTQENNIEIGQLIQVSAPITFNVNANAVSFIASLIGTSVQFVDSLFIIDVQTPGGITLPLKEVIFCDLGLCTIQVPKKPEIDTEPGAWRLRLGTLASSINLVDFDDYRLQLVSRIGPAPEIDATMRIAVKPFLTGSVSPGEITEILDRLSIMASISDIEVALEPVTLITEDRFTEVDSDFRDGNTASMVLMGEPDKVNLFFIEGFSDPGGGGLLGISGGLPGSLGLESVYNGVLINATATLGPNLDFYRRTTAEFAFHEINHLLGLFHTTEADFSEHDILNDTPDCSLANDINDNSKADADECPDGLNPMFWENDLSNSKTGLTSDQKSVLRYAPISSPTQ